MAKEVLVTTALTDEMIQAGAALLAQLKKHKIKLDGAFWWRLTEPDVWRLRLASPVVRKEGPLKLYKQLISVLATLPEDQPRLALDDIALIDAKEEKNKALVAAFRQLLTTQPTEATGRYISGGFVQTVPTEGAYVYQLKTSR